ncbi:MAG: SagB/ThcOx family dehydrogenase [Chloroflexota bacterium]
MARDAISLPDPDRRGQQTLERTLDRRWSCRTFTREPLTLVQIGQLLWAAQGVNSRGRRTAPSAGALYPLEVYAVLPEGVAHYEVLNHRLELLQRRDVRQELALAALGQDFIAVAPLSVVLCAVFKRVTARYGKARGERYVLIEIGHAAQNVLLQAEALGLGSVPVGAFADAEVHRLLGLPPDHVPLYLLPIGYPA